MLHCSVKKLIRYGFEKHQVLEEGVCFIHDEWPTPKDHKRELLKKFSMTVARLGSAACTIEILKHPKSLDSHYAYEGVSKSFWIGHLEW